MTDRSFDEGLQRIIEHYVLHARAELQARWDAWPLDLGKPEMHEVVGGLLARQVSLATQLARSPWIWNGHLGPIILRGMVDVLINLCWILEDPHERSRQYVRYGLGQEKLLFEHQKDALRANGEDPDQNEYLEEWQRSMNAERFPFIREVSVGSWSDINTRDMAEQANCRDLYRLSYSAFSACTHSMWNHVSKYNLMFCTNVLHGIHRVPMDPDMHPDLDYLFRAAKFLARSFERFDEKLKIHVSTPDAFTLLWDELDSFGRTLESRSAKAGGEAEKAAEEEKREAQSPPEGLS